MLKFFLLVHGHPRKDICVFGLDRIKSLTTGDARNNLIARTFLVAIIFSYNTIDLFYASCNDICWSRVFSRRNARHIFFLENNVPWRPAAAFDACM